MAVGKYILNMSVGDEGVFKDEKERHACHKFLRKFGVRVKTSKKDGVIKFWKIENGIGGVAKYQQFLSLEIGEGFAAQDEKSARHALKYLRNKGLIVSKRKLYIKRIA